MRAVSCGIKVMVRRNELMAAAKVDVVTQHAPLNMTNGADPEGDMPQAHGG